MKKNDSQYPILKCNSCQGKQENLKFYTCCFRSACQGCFDKDHNQKCKKQKSMSQTQYISIGQPPLSQIPLCIRCLESSKKDIYLCQHCKANFCKDCYDQLHSKDKFLLHVRQKLEDKCKQLFCTKHKKSKSIVTENNQILCVQCANQMKVKKYEDIKDCQASLVKEKLTNLAQQVKALMENHENKFIDLKKQLDFQFEKIRQIVSEKYASTMLTLQNYRNADKQFLSNLRCQLIENQSELQKISGQPTFKILSDIFQFRLYFMNGQLNKIIKSVSNLDKNEYKINFPSLLILQNAFNCISLQKIKPKSEQSQKDGRNLSRSRISNSKPKVLSDSRRNSQSFSNSQKKLSINVQKSIRKQIVNQENKFDAATSFFRQNKELCNQLRSTPMRGLKINSSNSKQNLKDRDCKVSMFASATVQNQNASAKIGDQKIKPHYVKRKSEYLEMRDKLRMPNLMNRFNKAAS